MDRYEELEKLYYKRKYLKIFRNSLLLIGIILIYLQNMKLSQKNTTKEIKKIEKNTTKSHIKQTKIIKHIQKNNSQPKKIKPEIKKLTLYPIFPEINMSKKPIVKEKVKTNKPQKKEKKQPKPEIKIIIKTQKQTLESLINAYNISPDYDQAIKIAKIYFDKKNYQKTIEWSKKANKFKPEDSQSWLLFAKSLIQLGKEKKAKEVLIAYLNTYGADKDIEKLLRSIK